MAMLYLIYQQKNRSIGEILFDYNAEPINSQLPSRESNFKDVYDFD
jgi:hypothetical protein